MRAPRFPAIPVASEMVFIGPVGSSLAHRRRSGRRLNLNRYLLIACVHGTVKMCSVVVRTMETMVIHRECGTTYRQRRYLAPRGKSRSRRCAVLVFSRLQRPGAHRPRGAGWQSQTVARGGGDEVAGLNRTRVHAPVFQGNRRRM